MDLKQLKALQAVAATGSFQRAAEQFNLTQAALSHQIRALEESLGETLLIRARPKVYPSPAGEAVLTAAQRILTEVMLLETRFATARTGSVSGSLRIAATTLSIVYLLGDICAAFVARYPGIELIFTATETAEAAMRRVSTGAADVAFGPLGDSEHFTKVVLAQSEHAFIVRSGHPLSTRSTVTLEELRQFPVVLFQPGSGTRSITDDLFLKDGGCYPAIVTESNDAQFAKRMVSMGLSSALMVVYAIGEDVLDRQLHMLRYAERPLMADVGIVHKRSVHMNSIELFKALCLDLRGPNVARITIENASQSPFRRGGAADPDTAEIGKAAPLGLG